MLHHRSSGFGLVFVRGIFLNILVLFSLYIVICRKVMVDGWHHESVIKISHWKRILSPFAHQLLKCDIQNINPLMPIAPKTLCLFLTIHIKKAIFLKNIYRRNVNLISFQFQLNSKCQSNTVAKRVSAYVKGCLHMICLFYIQLLSFCVCPDILVILIKKQVAQSNGLIAPKFKKK